MLITTENKAILKRLCKILKPYIKKIIAILICIILSSVITILLPFIGMKITDEGLVAGKLSVVVVYSLVTLCLVAFEKGIGLIETKYYAYINSIFPYTLSKMAFKHTLKLKMSYFNNTNFAEIMNNISMDVGNISKICDRSMFFIISQALRIFGGIIGLLIIDWRLTVLVVTIVPLRYFLVKYLAKKRVEILLKYMDQNREYSAWYGDTIGGVKEVKLWGIDRLKIGQFINKQRKIIKTNIKLVFMDKINENSEAILFQIITSALYILGAYMLMQNSMTLGGIFTFITYSYFVTEPVSAILNIGYHFSDIFPSAKRFFEFLDLEQEESSSTKGTRVLKSSSFEGFIKFEKVNFSYQQGEPILRDISFEIGKGEKIAIIGTNGSGKSTLVNLLLRFIKPDSGRITLDGIDINEFRVKDYRGLISVVSQDLYLFNTTIEENIAINTGIKEYGVHRAAKESGAYDFIMNIPQKFKYEVGRNGSKLSGGQKQKIAVARAFARKSSRIIILDEATSNYDMEAEARLNEILSQDFTEKNIILISHKPEILKKVDRIIIIDKGRINDMGKHEELYSRNELYRRLSRNKKEVEKEEREVV